MDNLDTFKKFLLEERLVGEATAKSYCWQAGSYLRSGLPVSEWIALPYKGKAVSGRARNVRRAAVARWFEFTGEAGKLPRSAKRDPADLLVYSAGDVVRWLEELRSVSIRELAAGWLVFDAALRRGDIVKAELSHLDLENMVLRVINGKGGKSRLAPFTDETAVLLRAYLRWRPEQQTPGPALLFLSNLGKRYQPRVMVSAVRGAAARAGLLEASICKRPVHLLRRCMATALADGGMDPWRLAELMGHEDLKTTLSYVRLSRSRVQEAYRAAHPLAQNRAAAAARRTA
ncbi:MAG: site-specific integrase [bacterium]|nr:site-specific integrase [bacterium]